MILQLLIVRRSIESTLDQVLQRHLRPRSAHGIGSPWVDAVACEGLVESHQSIHSENVPEILFKLRNFRSKHNAGFPPVRETRSSAEATAVRSPPPLSLVSTSDQIGAICVHWIWPNWPLEPFSWGGGPGSGTSSQPAIYMCTLYLAHMALGDLQWVTWGRGDQGSGTKFLSEPQNGCPAVTARCSDQKWTSHNDDCSPLPHPDRLTRTEKLSKVWMKSIAFATIHNRCLFTDIFQNRKPKKNTFVWSGRKTRGCIQKLTLRKVSFVEVFFWWTFVACKVTVWPKMGFHTQVPVYCFPHFAAWKTSAIPIIWISKNGNSFFFHQRHALSQVLAFLWSPFQ